MGFKRLKEQQKYGHLVQVEGGGSTFTQQLTLIFWEENIVHIVHHLHTLFLQKAKKLDLLSENIVFSNSNCDFVWSAGWLGHSNLEIVHPPFH